MTRKATAALLTVLVMVAMPLFAEKKMVIAASAMITGSEPTSPALSLSKYVPAAARTPPGTAAACTSGGAAVLKPLPLRCRRCRRPSSARPR